MFLNKTLFLNYYCGTLTNLDIAILKITTAASEACQTSISQLLVLPNRIIK